MRSKYQNFNFPKCSLEATENRDTSKCSSSNKEESGGGWGHGQARTERGHSAPVMSAPTFPVSMAM